MKSKRCNFLKLLLLITFLLVLISFLHHIPTLLSPTPTPLFPTQALPTKTGYLSVNPSTTSSIFYAFYEAQNPISPLFQTPLIIWLQGGPGCSSMFGNFFELGPWRVTSQKTSSSETFALEPNTGINFRFSQKLMLLGNCKFNYLTTILTLPFTCDSVSIYPLIISMVHDTLTLYLESNIWPSFPR